MISPRYPASIVPGAFRTVTPTLAARPERGCTRPTYPSGSSIATPVGTAARPPGGISTPSAAYRSAPASPGCAYVGSGRSGSSCRTPTVTLSMWLLSWSRPGVNERHRIVAYPRRVASEETARAARPPDIRFDERLTVPSWAWPIALGAAAFLAAEVFLGRSTPFSWVLY